MYDPLTDKKPYGAASTGEAVSFRFSVPQAESVRLFIVLRKGEDITRVEMKRVFSDSGEIVFEGGFVPAAAGLWFYRFEGILDSGEYAFYGRGADGRAVRGDWLPEWQLTVSETPYKTPDRAKIGVIYQIFADRFAKKGERPFYKKGRLHSDWYESPDIAAEGEDYRADDFFGGNIEGIISKLNYLKSLHVTCIYLSPIFRSSSNHRYDTGDYFEIDELFGDEEQFALLIKEAAKLGMRVLLDGVFNHTGADSVYFNKFGNYDSVGAYQSEQSPYRDWYYFSESEDEYHCWWGSTVVPTVNKSAEGWRRLIAGKNGVLEKWGSFGIGGWRLDVVDELPTDFTELVCAKIKSLDPDALIIGEVWEDASSKISYGLWRPYFMGRELDGVMNYPFRTAIIDYVLGGDAKAFREAASPILEHYPKQSLNVSMTLLGSHDTMRILTRLGQPEHLTDARQKASYFLPSEKYSLACSRLKLASAMQYTLPGVPCVYYGDECGMQGFEDPLNRGAYPWGREDTELLSHYRKLGTIRENYAALLQGETVFLDDPELLIYERRLAASDENGFSALRVFCNAGDKSAEPQISGFDIFNKREIEKIEVPAGGFAAIALR